MREILFRGKRVSDGEWVIGGIMKTFHPNYDCKNEEEFLSQKPNCYCICAKNKDFFVEQASIGQYTGLTDKNGNKIFEGDIVKCSDVDDCYYTEEKTEFFGVIKFEAGAFGIATKETLRIALDNWCENDNFVSLWELEWNEYIGNVEVIGNIHDNPELLGGGE